MVKGVEGRPCVYLLIFFRIAYGTSVTSSIIWCWPKGGDALRLKGIVPQVGRKS